MDMESVRRASNNFKRNVSATWRNNINNVSENFSFSTRDNEEDDEEALKWAALERLPTYDRLKKGILLGSRGSANQIDIQDLGYQERKKLIERLVEVVEEDNEKFLLKLKNRLDSVGIEVPTIEVRFEHLNVETEVHAGKRALPSFKNFFVNIFEGIANRLHIIPSRKRNISILRDASGILKPSRMTLLLGPPSSGKTTLLLALAGKLDSALKISGTLTYNGHNMKEFVSHRSAAYVSQNDVHMAEMTVRETLAFAARCQGVGTSHEMMEELLRREKAAKIKPDPDVDIFMKAATAKGQEANIVTDYIIKVLGLETCADTLVGNEIVRGISGGQRKRVTTGEMLVGRAKAFFMDEISTGLDSSTTFQVVNSIRNLVHILKGTALITLLQPEPDTFDLFDDLILISEGQIVYQGPRENVVEFFQFMGFKCPERKGVADFLQEVTSKNDQQQYWAHHDMPYMFITVGEFAEAFQSFEIGKKLTAELSIPFDKSNSHPAALATGKYGVSKKELFKACASRELLLMKRNSFVHVFMIVRHAVMAILVASVFFRTQIHRDNTRDGRMVVASLFFLVVTVILGGLIEIAFTIQKLPVFYKQRKLFFYPAWAYALPSWIVKLPVQFLEIFVFVAFSYYLVGYDPNIGRLLKQFLLLFLETQLAASLNRFMAGIGRTMVVTNTYAFFIILLTLTLSGFLLPRDKIKKWWTWGYWCSPMMYAQNAIVVNEFTSHSWGHVLPFTNVSLGVEVLKSEGYFSSKNWYWIGVSALFGMILLYNVAFILALTYLNPREKRQSILSEDGNQTDVITEEIDGNDEEKRKGIMLPFEPHSITFDEIKYSIDMPQEMKNQGANEDRLVLLRGVNGAFRPGVLTALMGVSGAGKTTLMDVLAGRKTGGYIEGNITVSGYPKKQETFARISGYCEQNDIHSPHLTVYEALLFSAWLRLPPEVDHETRKKFVEKVMELVELTRLRGGLVGLPGINGLSTEQRKRLTIAVELVANPSIIFMDEPTSGLDARAAAIVMRTVRNTVDTGRTVVCTIHQPSIDIFESFDELLLLKRGGEEIYVGPLGRHSCHLIQYFEGIQGVKKIREGYNPAAWMLEITSSAQETMLEVDFGELYRNSELYRRNKSLIQELSSPRPGMRELDFPTKYSQPFFTQWMACLWKLHWSYWRNTTYTAVKILYAAVLSIIFGSLFWDLGSQKGTAHDILNAMGSMYGAVYFLGVQSATSVQPVVFVERAVFYREKAAGMYSALPFAFAQVVIEIPYIFAQALSYGTIVYAMIGFEWIAKKYMWYMFFTFFSLLYFTYFGMMVASLTPSQQLASIFSTSVYAFWNLFSGFIIPRPSTPIWWRWYHYACPLAWTLYGLVASQFGDIKDQLDTAQSVQDFVRTYFGFRHDFVGVVAVIVVVFMFVFAFSFAISIRTLNFQRR